jgi:hypothetical protein
VKGLWHLLQARIDWLIRDELISAKDHALLKLYRSKSPGLKTQQRNQKFDDGQGIPLGGEGKFAGFLNLSRLRFVASALRILSIRI